MLSPWSYSWPYGPDPRSPGRRDAGACRRGDRRLPGRTAARGLRRLDAGGQVKDYWEELHPTSAGGAYVNFLMDEGQDRVTASYRGNYDRLAQVKRRYDPTNAFHVNQNIPPAD